MTHHTDCQALLVDNLELIERIARAVARRQGLGSADADDLVGWVRLRLVEDDYAILRKFRGESALGTYLTVVIAMLGRDYRVRQRGRWRPSAAAIRQGEVAVRLETLVHQQGYPFRQAAEILRTSGGTRLSDRELAGLLASLPARQPLRPREVGSEPLAFEADEGATADTTVMAEADEEEKRRILSLLDAEIAKLPPQEQVVLKMCFRDGLTVADVARTLGLKQSALYKDIDRSLRKLRASLEQARIYKDDVRPYLGSIP